MCFVRPGEVAVDHSSDEKRLSVEQCFHRCSDAMGTLCSVVHTQGKWEEFVVILLKLECHLYGLSFLSVFLNIIHSVIAFVNCGPSMW